MSNTKVSKQQNSASVVISLALALAVLAAAFFIKTPVGVFTPEMLRAICVIAAAIILWVKQPIPLAISSLALLVLLPRLGLAKNLNEAFSGFTNATNYFVIASFGLAIAVKKTTISSKILRRLLVISRGKAKNVVLAFMAMTYIVSSVMSDIPAVMIGIAFARQLLDSMNEEDRKAFGKPLMLAIPFGSIIGGTSTPAGSSVNVMALNLLSANTGVEISFLQWVALGLPVSLLLLFAGWWIITHVTRIPELTSEQMDAFLDSMAQNTRSSVKNEKYVVGVICLMIAAWIAGTWVSALDMTTVAVFGLLLLILPGVGAFTWKEFAAGVPWEIFLMGGATIMMGTLARSTGLVQLLADTLQANFAGISPAMLVVLLGVVVTAILVIMPVGPATVSMLVMPVYALATALGINPMMAVITLGAFASNCCILPLNSVMLLSFGTGYWKITDLVKVGLLITAVWLALAALWYPLAAGLVL